MRSLAPLVALVALAAATPALADALIDNVTGMTLDKDGRVIRFNALLISPEGKVIGRFRATGVRPKCNDRIMAAGLTLPMDMFDHVKAVA